MINVKLKKATLTKVTLIYAKKLKFICIYVLKCLYILCIRE